MDIRQTHLYTNNLSKCSRKKELSTLIMTPTFIHIRTYTSVRVFLKIIRIRNVNPLRPINVSSRRLSIVYTLTYTKNT